MSLPNGTMVAAALRPQFILPLPLLERLQQLLNRPDAPTEYTIEELHEHLRPDSLGDLAQLLCSLVQRGYFERCYRVVTPSAVEGLEYGSLLQVPDTISIGGVSRPMEVEDLKILYRRLAAVASSGA